MNDSLLTALRRLFAAPLDTLLAMIGSGALLALLCLGYWLFAPVALLMQGVAATPELAVFLPVTADRKAAISLEQKLKAQPGVAKTRLIAREDTLTRMKTKGAGGLADAIAVLPDNPFPDAIVVTPADDDPATLEALAATVRQWREIEHVQVDADWARRLAAINRLLKAGGMLLAGLLTLALIAIVFNAVRLRAAIERAQAHAGSFPTAGIDHRPALLCQGLLLGFFGGLTAWLIVSGTVLWLRLPVAELAGLYGFDFTLALPGMREIGALLGISILLGGCGALLACDWRGRGA